MTSSTWTPKRNGECDLGSARGGAQDGAGLALEDLREVARLVHVVVVAARGVGDALHEQLVVLHAEADGGHADSVLGGALGDAGQFA